jgi:hypothetical protein
MVCFFRHRLLDSFYSHNSIGMLVLKDHAHLVSPVRRQHPFVWLRDFIRAQTRGYDEEVWKKHGSIVIVHHDGGGRPTGHGIDKTNKVIQAKVQTLERNLSRTQCRWNAYRVTLL